MNHHLTRWGFVAVVALASMSGCRHCCRRPAAPACPAPSPGFVPGPPATLGAPAPPPPSNPPPAPVAPADARYYPPSVALDSPWQPLPQAPRDPVRLSPPESAKPPVTEERSTSPLLPVGIPQFAIAKDQVASGLKPFPDGLEWLKNSGYRAVLHVRRPGEDDSAARRQVEKVGLTYLTIEVAPQSLSRVVVDEFNRTVDSTAYLPLFVYDRDGMLAGGLWYLNFRTAEQASDEEARIRATRLGLKAATDEAHKEMWLAIQRFLSEAK